MQPRNLWRFFPFDDGGGEHPSYVKRMLHGSELEGKFNQLSHPVPSFTSHTDEKRAWRGVEVVC